MAGAEEVNRRIEPHDVVVLKRDVPSLALLCGDVGTVISTLHAGKILVLEMGLTPDRPTDLHVNADAVRLPRRDEVLHVRSVSDTRQGMPAESRAAVPA